jgi:transcription initiation factor IIE alpha subunit
MAVRTVRIKAIEVVKCIRSGMDDAGIMEQFGISAQSLQSLFTQLESAGIINRNELERRSQRSYSSVIIDVDKATFPVNVRKSVIDAAEALKLIKSGITDTELMKRYNLSGRGVQSLLRKLMIIGLITPDEADARFDDTATSVIVDEEIRPKTGEIDLDELLAKIRSGESKADICEKYSISDSDLDERLSRLIDRGMIDKRELEQRLSTPERTFEIRRKQDHGLIYSGASKTLGRLVEKAARFGIDLSDSDLSSADLSKADLTGVRLCGADLRRANLVGTDFTAANLTRAQMGSSNLFGATLYKAKLAGADLSDANLSMVYGVWAFMPEVNFSESNLAHANLSGANLANALMFEAILEDTNLNGAYLEGVNLEAAKRTRSSLSVRAGA